MPPFRQWLRSPMKSKSAKIIRKSAEVIDEKSLRTWDSEDVLAVYDALVRAHESINK